MGPLVSIGVAVYNVREYLCACLGSVCKQASEEIEILLVDEIGRASCRERVYVLV